MPAKAHVSVGGHPIIFLNSRTHRNTTNVIRDPFITVYATLPEFAEISPKTGTMLYVFF